MLLGWDVQLEDQKRRCDGHDRIGENDERFSGSHGLFGPSKGEERPDRPVAERARLVVFGYLDSFFFFFFHTVSLRWQRLENQPAPSASEAPGACVVDYA